MICFCNDIYCNVKKETYFIFTTFNVVQVSISNIIIKYYLKRNYRSIVSLKIKDLDWNSRSLIESKKVNFLWGERQRDRHEMEKRWDKVIVTRGEVVLNNKGAHTDNKANSLKF